jgi:hypothetical protein
LGIAVRIAGPPASKKLALSVRAAGSKKGSVIQTPRSTVAPGQKFTDGLMIRRSIDRIKRYLLYSQCTKMIVIDLDAGKNERRPVLDKGLIRFGDMSMSCVIHNLSKSGVALDIGSQVGIPDQFTLIDVAAKKIYSCNVVWRKGHRIGVAFY